MVPNCYLVVGVCSDKDIEENKGSVVMNEVERVESIKHCKWVD
jgi:choline-phosphate cytidylyltransferase